jgi:hypothetical protein
MSGTVTLFRPVGTKELDLIRASEMIAFPQRLPDQPIFYPVNNEGYAVEIARDWNARHNDDHRGYVTRFAVNKSCLDRYQPQTVGARRHKEYWIPAEDLQDFNAKIVGAIEVIGSFENTAS